MRIILLTIMAVAFISAAVLRHTNKPEPVFQDWDRVRDCKLAVGQFAEQGTDLWYEQMEQCVYLDADYLTPVYEAINLEEQVQ